MLGLGSRDGNLQDVESNGLRQRSTLTNNDDVTLLDTESWGNVSSDVLVSLLVSVVFRDKVEVVSSDDDSSVHFGGHNSTGHDLTSDGDVTDPWALLVNVRTLNSLLWGLESQTDFLDPSLGLLVGLGLRVGEDVWLLNLLVSLFVWKYTSLIRCRVAVEILSLLGFSSCL